MFFDKILVENKVLRKVWRAGNHLVPEELVNTSLSNICVTVDRWVESEDNDARRRVSLRTSSVLIKGAALLYKTEANQLFEDVAKLDREMVLRNRRNRHSCDEDYKTTTSGFYETPEQMMRQAERHPDVSFEAQTRSSSLSSSSPRLNKSHSYITSRKDSSSNRSTKRESNKTEGSNHQSKKRVLYTDRENQLDKTPSLSSDRKYDSLIESFTSSDRETNGSRSGTQKTESSDPNESAEESDHASRRSIILRSASTVPRERRNKKGPKSIIKERKVQASQTVSFRPSMSNRDANTFDENHPIGCLHIYESTHSRVPSHIVISSLNVNNLFSL